MRAVIALAVILVETTVGSAQGRQDVVANAAKLPGWTEQYGGDLATMTGWAVDGSHSIGKGELNLGGPTGATLRMLDPLGDDFKLLIEYRVDTTRPAEPRLVMEQERLFGLTRHSRHFTGSKDGWTQMLLVQQPGPGGGHQLVQTIVSKTLEMGGMIVEGDPVRRIDIVVEPGATLTVRRIRVLTITPPPAGRSLMGPLTVLGVVLAGVMVAGWLRHRRQAAT